MERLAMVGQEGRAAEKKDEELEGVRPPCLVIGERIGPPVEQVALAARQIEDLSEVDLQEIFGDGERAPEIQPPVPAIGEHAPSEAALGHVVDAPEIAEHLRRRYAILARSARLFAIEQPVPALRLDDAYAVLKALPGWKRRGFRLRLGVGKQQRVGNVVPRFQREVRLHRHVGPADCLQRGPDQLGLGFRFDRILDLAEGR
jgi:hypothetical protein